jgi:predicted HicB family RNase H-like nuclease
MENKMKKKRIIIEVSDQVHKEVKMLALMQNISMTEFILRALTEALKKQKQYE